MAKLSSINRLVVVETRLKMPYHKSIEGIHELARIWGLMILSAGTSKPVAIMGYPDSTFRQMFRQTPKKGPLEVPVQMEYFVNGMTITGFMES